MANIQFNFSGRHVLVTGGGQGIGREITERFLKSGAQVTVWEYSSDSLGQLEKDLGAQHPGRLHLAQVDVSDFSSCVRSAGQLTDPIHILVNNAGITRDKSLAKMDVEDFNQVIATNLTGLFHVTKSLLQNFSGESVNRIINMSSVVALYGNFGQTNYVAAKSGVIGLTKTWAKELGRKGFTVNAVAPGFTETPMVAKMPAEILKGMAEKVAVQRLGQPEDIACACMYLATEEAGYINGAVLSVDGGLTI